MSILSGNVNFASLIDEVALRGVAFEPHAVTDLCLPAIVAAAENVPFEARSGDDPEYQYEDSRIFDRQPHCPEILELGDELAWKVRMSSGKHRALAGWQPNDIVVQRYRDENDGIEAHCDYSSDLLLIASFTVLGYGPFEILNQRRGGRVVKVYETGPGSLLLMWAPGLGGIGDRRPVHRAMNPIVTPRISVTYRFKMHDLV